MPGSACTSDWQAAIDHPEVKIVIVSTTNDSLAEISKRARQKAGKHVLVEKPAARTSQELEAVIKAAKENKNPGAGRIQPPLSSCNAKGQRIGPCG